MDKIQETPQENSNLIAFICKLIQNVKDIFWYSIATGKYCNCSSDDQALSGWLCCGSKSFGLKIFKQVLLMLFFGCCLPML